MGKEGWMEITLTIPEKVATILQQQWPGEDLPRHILEDLILKWYQEDLLTDEEVRVALGLATQNQLGQSCALSPIPHRCTT